MRYERLLSQRRTRENEIRLISWIILTSESFYILHFTFERGSRKLRTCVYEKPRSKPERKQRSNFLTKFDLMTREVQLKKSKRFNMSMIKSEIYKKFECVMWLTIYNTCIKYIFFYFAWTMSIGHHTRTDISFNSQYKKLKKNHFTCTLNIL